MSRDWAENGAEDHRRVERQDGRPGTGPGDTVTAPVAGGDYEEALAALVMLGFGKAAADKVVKIVARENPGASVEDLVRMSLKRL